MSTHREGIFVEGLWVEKSRPEKVEPEVGSTSAPLYSAAYFIGQFCEAYNQDYMLCKKQNGGDPFACALEGRKVTRCSIDLIQKLKMNCDKEWTEHWTCLDGNNQMLEKCRKNEKGLTKTIPDTPDGSIPIHLKPNPQYK